MLDTNGAREYVLVEGLCVGVKHRVDETDWALSSGKTFFVDTSDDGCEDWGRCRCSTKGTWDTVPVQEDVVSDGTYVWVFEGISTYLKRRKAEVADKGMG